MLGILATIALGAIAVSFAQDNSTAAAAIAAALLGILSVVYQQDRQKALDLEQVRRDKMTPAFEDLLDMYIRMMQTVGRRAIEKMSLAGTMEAVVESTGFELSQMEGAGAEFNSKLLLQASAHVVKALIEVERAVVGLSQESLAELLQELLQEESPEAQTEFWLIYQSMYQSFLTFEYLIRAIRRDLGHDDSALEKGELALVFFPLGEAIGQIAESHQHAHALEPG